MPHCHIMVYMRIVLTTLVTVTCLLGDNFVELTQHPLLKALADNATHAAIGALTGIAFSMQFYERTTQLFGWILIFTCFVVSSFIDLDHFVEARSLYLEDATNLSRRPFLHCSSIILVMLLFYMCTACLNYFRTSLLLGALLCAFITHHTRDAVRRGYWMCPMGHTDRVPQVAYILITIMTPHLLGCLHALCRSVLVLNFLGQYVKLSECNYRGGPGSGSGCSNANYRYMQV
ncbi:transmembrane protein 267 [Drosophila guanche]|uniref:Transmembrane protein 267 n=1 Tax=Drosophila guanche TaxID=7266 RepID=A0A3B0JVY4_DROGU|nr:transmembrane protein 267 [Drosophila guanche]SPP85233.1 blast:Transmembrane protein C5orf28 homolog [Drosophila guanche]